MLGRNDDPELGDRLDPVYPTVEGVGPMTMRKLIGQALAPTRRSAAWRWKSCWPTTSACVASALPCRHTMRRRWPAPANWPSAAEAAAVALTGAQARVFKQIREDLARPSPMLRLVQGDVGSGKTVVAALAAMLAVEQGKQVALAAPTELLAEQHLNNLRGWLEPLGVRIAWLAGKSPARRAPR